MGTSYTLNGSLGLSATYLNVLPVPSEDFVNRVHVTRVVLPVIFDELGAGALPG